MHSDNPCQYDDKAIAAKTWELLRRNEQFRADANCYLKHWRDGGRENRDAAWSFMQSLEDEHDFAAAAIRWIVPEPYFTRILPRRVDGTDMEGNAAKWDLVWHGFNPVTPPEPNLAWMRKKKLSAKKRAEHLRALAEAGWMVNDDRPSMKGSPCRLGPHFYWCEGDQVDHALEWTAYQNSCATTKDVALYDRPWRDLPKPLQRAFHYHWRNLLAGQVNPFTGKCDRHPPHVVDFGKQARREMLTGGKDTYLALALRLQTYSDNYILFAFPKGKHLSKGQITAVCKEWEAAIEKANILLPVNGEPLGTRQEWNVFLLAQDHMRNGKSREAAIRQAYTDTKFAEKRGKMNWNKDSGKFLSYFARINSELTAGIYPKLDFPRLFSKPD